MKKAVFVVCTDGQTICATTRENGNKIGLPGGKSEEGESLFQTAIRESFEEGWHFNIKSEEVDIFHKETNEKGMEIYWVILDFDGKPVQIKDNKEKHRGIVSIIASVDELAESGYGNECLYYLKEENYGY